MNTSFLSIIKRIVAEQGENILSDAARLKPFISDYAKDEPKEDRVAFGRAIELGFYNELKRAAPHDRANVKASLVPRLQTVTNLDATRCMAAIDLIEAAIYGNAAPIQQTYTPAAPAPTYQQPVYQQPQQQYYQQPGSQPMQNETDYPKPTNLIITAWVIFGVSCVTAFIDYNLSLIADVGVIICIILLFANKNKDAKKHGRNLLIIEIIAFAISFVSGFLDAIL